MKSLLFTGASGFLGSNTLFKLIRQYDVDTLNFSNSSTYEVNLANQKPVLNRRYEIVLHASGKAHCIPSNKEDENQFYAINFQGTKNICAGLEKFDPPDSFVFISTVAVYGCESGECLTEDSRLDPNTPYGKSKLQAEQYLSEWCEHRCVSLTILRPSLLAGRNPPGNLGAMINGIASGRYLSIADGKARKSIAMAEDIARLIPHCENKSGIFNLCDDLNPSFRELEELISKQLNKPLPIGIPMWLAKCLATTGDLFNLSVINTQKLCKITQTLTFSNEKIKNELGFFPSNVLDNFVIR